MKHRKKYTVEKKIHSRKALIITNKEKKRKEKKILYVSALFTGKTHDYEILKRSIPKNTDCLLAKQILVERRFYRHKKRLQNRKFEYSSQEKKSEKR